MTVFTLYPWHESAWRDLQQRKAQLPHALLMHGLQGMGKHDFVQAWLATLFCMQPQSHAFGHVACGQCTACAHIQQHTHPNVRWLVRETDAKGKQAQFIKIDQVRELPDFIQQTSEQYRVVVVDLAEDMNTAAANAFLKTLEEPPKNVLLVLLSENPSQVLPTIKSRVQAVSLNCQSSALAESYVQQHLADLAHGSAQQLAIVMNLSARAPLAAVRLAKENAFMARQAIVDDWVQLRTKRTDPIRLGQKWLSQWGWPVVMQVLLWHIRDLAATLQQLPVIQTDIQYAALTPHVTMSYLFALEHFVYEQQPLLAQNVQAALVLDELTFKLAGMGWV